MTTSSIKFPFLAILLCLFAAPSFAGSSAEFDPPVEQWGVFELSLKGPEEGNPFVDVRFSAVFSDGSRKVEVPGFYDGGGVYRIRFMPDTVGEWRYETLSNRWPLTGKRGAFRSTAPGAGNHGPVRVRNTYHFAYADGTPFRQIGTTIYSWQHRPEAMQEQTLKALAASPFNKVRMLVFPHDHAIKPEQTPPTLFPYVGTPPKQWDFSRFNPEFFQHLDQCVAKLRDLGIEADLILFHPYGKPWGFDTMDTSSDELYLRYIVARLSAYRNVWWSLANEYDFLRTKTESDWDRYFQVVQQADPAGHLRSIHNGFKIYNNNHPWVTHASIQNGAAVEDVLRAQLYRDIWRKPVVFDEVKYEGNLKRRWAQLSGLEMVHRFWCGTVAGTYVGHSECFDNPEDLYWLGQGVRLTGQSPARLAFLRKIMEEGPAEGIEPVDKWQEPYMGGKAGEYYLVYFGTQAPNSWQFRLYKDALREGIQFKVEVIDVWNMTITPVEGVFVTGKKSDYCFLDEQGRSVPLPGKPYQALRIRRVGGAPALSLGEVPVE
jgi:hypothetical protein